jgi:hypothetical protein
MPITDRLLERLERKSVRSMTVQGQSEPTLMPHSELLLSAFPSQTVLELQNTAMAAERAIHVVVEQMRLHEDIDCSEMKSSIEQFAEQARRDISASLAVLSKRLPQVDRELTDKLIGRSTTLSLLGITTDILLNLADDDLMEVRLSGLLHDCLLLLHPEWFDESHGMEGNSRLLAEFRNHPMESQEVLAGNEIVMSARILNLSDAFLNLVQPRFKKDRIQNSDAIAYLCYHASRRRFDPQVLRGFIDGQSMYPIGSLVQLDDDSNAIVIMSNQRRPMEPSVQILGTNKRLTDLSTSPRCIIGPMETDSPEVIRIAKSMMDPLLWRSDIGLEPVFQPCT